MSGRWRCARLPVRPEVIQDPAAPRTAQRDLYLPNTTPRRIEGRASWPACSSWHSLCSSYGEHPSAPRARQATGEPDELTPVEARPEKRSGRKLCLCYWLPFLRRPSTLHPLNDRAVDGEGP
jgi:hypothetical protein